MEMTKWFDTNYHYISLPNGMPTPAAHSANLIAQIKEARALGRWMSKPTLVEPLTLLWLGKRRIRLPRGNPAAEALCPLMRNCCANWPPRVWIGFKSTSRFWRWMRREPYLMLSRLCIKSWPTPACALFSALICFGGRAFDLLKNLPVHGVTSMPCARPKAWRCLPNASPENKVLSVGS